MNKWLQAATQPIGPNREEKVLSVLIRRGKTLTPTIEATSARILSSRPHAIGATAYIDGPHCLTRRLETTLDLRTARPTRAALVWPVSIIGKSK